MYGVVRLAVGAFSGSRVAWESSVGVVGVVGGCPERSVLRSRRMLCLRLVLTSLANLWKREASE